MTDGRFYLAGLDKGWHPYRWTRWDGDWASLIHSLIKNEDSRVCLVQTREQDGLRLPLAADIALTRWLVRSVRPLGIDLADHVIATRTAQFSFRRTGLL